MVSSHDVDSQHLKMQACGVECCDEGVQCTWHGEGAGEPRRVQVAGGREVLLLLLIIIIIIIVIIIMIMIMIVVMIIVRII